MNEQSPYGSSCRSPLRTASKHGSCRCTPLVVSNQSIVLLLSINTTSRQQKPSKTHSSLGTIALHLHRGGIPFFDTVRQGKQRRPKKKHTHTADNVMNHVFDTVRQKKRQNAPTYTHARAADTQMMVKRRRSNEPRVPAWRATALLSRESIPSS